MTQVRSTALANFKEAGLAAYIDTRLGAMRITSCGHFPGILVHASGGLERRCIALRPNRLHTTAAAVRSARGSFGEPSLDRKFRIRPIGCARHPSVNGLEHAAVSRGSHSGATFEQPSKE